MKHNRQSYRGRCLATFDGRPVEGLARLFFCTIYVIINSSAAQLVNFQSPALGVLCLWPAWFLEASPYYYGLAWSRLIAGVTLTAKLTPSSRMQDQPRAA